MATDSSKHFEKIGQDKTSVVWIKLDDGIYLYSHCLLPGENVLTPSPKIMS